MAFDPGGVNHVVMGRAARTGPVTTICEQSSGKRAAAE